MYVPKMTKATRQAAAMNASAQSHMIRLWEQPKVVLVSLRAG